MAWPKVRVAWVVTGARIGSRHVTDITYIKWPRIATAAGTMPTMRFSPRVSIGLSARKLALPGSKQETTAIVIRNRPLPRKSGS